jgi:hypothetical protein
VVDFYRLEFGRTIFKFSSYTHRRDWPRLLSLDGGSGEGELDFPLSAEQSELEAGDIDLRGVLAG